MKLNRIVLILGIVLVLLAISACGGGATEETPAEEDTGAAEEQPVAEDTTDDAADDAAVEEEEVVEEAPELADITFSTFAAEKIDPSLAAEEDTDLIAVSEMIYSRLVDLEDGEIVAGLASEWSLSDDELTYEFKLRPNAVFTDGTKVTSDVILANFNRWFDPENPLHGDDDAVYVAWLANFDGFRGEVVGEEEDPVSKFDGIEKVDDLVFLIHLNVPMDNFLDVISGAEFSILNPALMESEGDAHATMDGSVVGTGAYQVLSWDDAGLVLTPSETYWGE